MCVVMTYNYIHFLNYVKKNTFYAALSAVVFWENS